MTWVSGTRQDGRSHPELNAGVAGSSQSIHTIFGLYLRLFARDIKIWNNFKFSKFMQNLQNLVID